VSANLRALTIHQPWAWFIAKGYKPIENRSWRPPQSLVGNWLAIHAGKKWDIAEVASNTSFAHVNCRAPLPSSIGAMGDQCGSILAVARVTGFVAESASPWFFGPVGWTLADVVELPEPVACRGAQGLWKVPADVYERVLVQWRRRLNAEEVYR